MDLVTQLRDRLAHAHLTADERTLLCCQLAKELEESGDYEGARETMGGLWRRVGERPTLEGLGEAARAEVLLRVGVLTGWIGSVKQLENAQEEAKNLITESLRLFESLQAAEKVDEAQTELACCYWRQGSFDEARLILRQVLDRLADSESEVKMVAVIRAAIVEWTSKRYHDALRIQTEYTPLFERCSKHALKGKFHNGFGVVLDLLGTSEGREDYIDRAFIEYTAASYHFEQAGHLRYCGCVENNLAMLYLAVDKPNEAHRHLDRARSMFASLKDKHIAQVDETRAKVLLAEGRNEEAEKFAAAATRVLGQGDENSLLAEALTTYGTALARSGRRVRARLALQRAIAVAQQAGDKASAGRALLAMIEELADTSALAEVCAQFEQAAEQLSDSQHSIAARLIQAARMVIKRFSPDSAGANAGLFTPPQTWEGFSLRKELRRYEKYLIACALKDARGVVTRAAHMLGYKHHYSLIHLINRRHKSLMPARSPVFRRRPRKISLIQKKGGPPRKAEEQSRPAAILHVEDHQAVAEAVKDTLESEGFSVSSCSDGAAALGAIDSDEVFDLLILDNNLPSVNGIELIQYARRLPHRQSTPIIMLSASEVEAEAREAGADVFLKKPHDISELAATVKRLLSDSE